MNLDDEKIWRDNVVLCALKYANHTWIPTKQNLYHGFDNGGILVNTPDVDYSNIKYQCGWWHANQENKGIPYKWGGCSTIENFDNAILNGKFAGNVPDNKDAGISNHCVGVDCSGLLTLCWGVSSRLYTKTIPEITTVLDSFNSLLPGDIILLPGNHVMIFIKFKDDKEKYVKIVDSTRSTGKVSLRTIEVLKLLNIGYSGYRYHK